MPLARLRIGPSVPLPSASSIPFVVFMILVDLSLMMTILCRASRSQCGKRVQIILTLQTFSYFDLYAVGK